MDGQYPIKPYVKPKGTTITTHKLKGKFGKVIELFCDESKPEVVSFHIKTSRGTLKETIEVSLEEALALAKTITVWDDYLAKKQ